MRKLGTLAVIVPCYNEEEVLRSTHGRLRSILDGLVRDSKCRDYEIVYVNDGSSDGTQKILDEIFKEDRRARVIVLRRNFGLQGALSAGLCLARGDAAVTIDADLQDPPEKIGEMIAYYEQEYDLVLGVREDRQSDTFLKRFTAENYYRFLKVLGVDVVHNHGDFRFMARPLVDEFNALTEKSRYIRGMVLALDNHYAKVFYKRQAREQGVTKFNFGRMLSLSLDGVLSFTFMPLRFVSILGVIACLFAAVGSGYILYAKVAGQVIPGWSSTVLPLFIFSGLQLLSLGIIGEYVGRSYMEIKNRPLFSVRKEHTH